MQYVICKLLHINITPPFLPSNSEDNFNEKTKVPVFFTLRTLRFLIDIIVEAMETKYYLQVL